MQIETYVQVQQPHTPSMYMSFIALVVHLMEQKLINSELYLSTKWYKNMTTVVCTYNEINVDEAWEKMSNGVKCRGGVNQGAS